MEKSQKNLNILDAEGNTNLPRFRSRKFFITYNNYTESHYLNLLNYCKSKDVVRYCICKEFAPTTGTPHLHIFLEYKNQKYVTEICKKCPELAFCTDYQAAKGTLEDQVRYCSKEGIEFNTNIDNVIPLELDIITELYPWQQNFKDILMQKPDKRTVYWIYDPVGKNGKTEFLKYMVYHFKAIFTCGGKRNDIINLIYNNKKYMLCSNSRVVLWNLPRDINNEFISYEAIEMIKDGLISNNKFECGSFICNSPHIIVMGNTLPLFRKLTKDRWVVYTINQNKELVDYIEEDLFDGED